MFHFDVHSDVVAEFPSEADRQAEFFKRAGPRMKAVAMGYLGVPRLDARTSEDLDIIICDVLERCWEAKKTGREVELLAELAGAVQCY